MLVTASKPKQFYRDVDWSETEMWNKTIEADWGKEDQLVIETASEKHNFSETYQLNAGGRVLTLIIDVNSSQRDDEDRRVFERKTLP